MPTPVGSRKTSLASTSGLPPKRRALASKFMLPVAAGRLSLSLPNAHYDVKVVWCSLRNWSRVHVLEDEYLRQSNHSIYNLRSTFDYKLDVLL